MTSLFNLRTGPLLQTGCVIAQSDQAGVAGFTAFGYDDGTHRSTATLPASSTPLQQFLFSHVAHEVPAAVGRTFQTGVAPLNPFGTTVGYTMRIFDGTGALVAQENDTLRPHQKVAKILRHPVAGAGFFTQTLVLGSGHIEISSDYGVMGLELFFTEEFSHLAGVSAQVPSPPKVGKLRFTARVLACLSGNTASLNGCCDSDDWPA